MKNLFINFVFSIFLVTPLLGSDFPILDPQDPQYAWMDRLIERDFLPFKNGFTLQQVTAAVDSNAYNVRIQVIDRKVYGPLGAARSMMEYLVQHYKVPDVDFAYYQHDGIYISWPGHASPLLSGARVKGNKNIILFVDWYYLIESEKSTWNTWIKTIDEMIDILPYEDRLEKVIWRGSNTDTPSGGMYRLSNWFKHPRGTACALSKRFPDLIDVGFNQLLP